MDGSRTGYNPFFLHIDSFLFNGDCFVTTSLLQVILSILCAALGAGALFGRRPIAGGIRAPRPLRWAWGGLTLLGAILLAISARVPFFTFFAASLLTLLLASALIAVLAQRRGLKEPLAIGALLLGVMAAGAAQPLGLKVLALPKADALPRSLLPSTRVVKTYGPGLWFEGIGAAPDGTLYLAGNKGEDYASGDKRQVQAELIARAPNGSERLFFKLPQGSTAGVMTFAADGTLYMTGTGADLGIWRITPDGTGNLMAKLPKGSWPNGITLGPDACAYVADSSLGVIWRLDLRSGAVTTAFEGDVLRARRYIALPPGANGLHFFGRDLLVTVSDSGKLLKFHLNPEGRLEPPTVAASGIPADDFAIDSRGAVYLTTHVYNTLVRVDPDGRRTVVGDATNGIVGATDCVFGTRPEDRDTLYVVTDGGALSSGDPGARGTLVAIKVPAP